MKKYQSYKPSGVEWIGEIPEGWNVKKLKELFVNRNEKNEDLCEDFLSLTKDRGVIPYSEKGNVGNKTSEDIGKYRTHIHLKFLLVSEQYRHLIKLHYILKSQLNL